MLRHKLAAVLLCVSVLRGWWRGLHETALRSSAHAEIAEGGHDGDWKETSTWTRPGRRTRTR